MYFLSAKWFSSVQFSCSVVSHSLWPHELQHTRPPCPSPTPGVHSNSHHRVPLVTPWTIVCQTPLSMRFFRQEYWSGLPFPYPGDLPDPGIEPESSALQVNSCLAGGVFTNWATREALLLSFIFLLIFWYISFRSYCLFLKWDDTIHTWSFSQWYMSQTFSHNIDTSWHNFFSF